MKFFQKTKGTISIFLALIMLPMFTCAGLIVDGARISAARTALTGAGDLTMNAALSEYDQILQDVYGLFAMSESPAALEKNVSRYFSDTINNTGILQGSDSYTRSFINSIGSWFSTADISFDNIIDTQVDEFNLVSVPNSALGNPSVLNRQIIEYMKYRGPVSIGTGLLTKLGCIGETSKQTKALEAKVNYEKKLDSVQDACETAYNAINTFNTVVDGTNFKGDYLTACNSDLGEAYQLMKEAVSYIVAAKSPSYKVADLKEDENLKKEVKDEIDGLTGADINMQVYNLMKDKLKGIVEFEVNGSGNYVAKDTEYTLAVKKYFAYGPGDTLQSQSQYIVDVKSNFSNFTKMHTYLLIMDDYYDKLTADEQASLQKENEAYATIEGQLQTVVNGAKNASTGWKASANDKGRQATRKLYDRWYSNISTIDESLEDAIEALNAVLDKVGELDSQRTSWKNKVDDLSDGDIKTSMQGDYENSAKDINEAAINDLIGVLEGNRSHFTKIKDKLDSVKLYDQKICFANCDSVDYYNCFSAIPELEINAAYTLSDRTESVMNNYTNADVKSGITPATFQKITESHQFYKFLKNTCSSVSGESEEKKTAKNNRKELINQGNKESNTKADLSGLVTGSYIGGSGINSSISDAIDALANGEDSAPNSFDPTKIDSGAKNDKMADQSKSNLSAISTLLENLSKIGETARDKVYLEEYITEMFSCYTSGVGPGGAAVPAKTLSNKDMSTNKFYRSEIEYILWGNDSVDANLNNTKALIFGIRFALNSVYAFTSSDTRTPALAAATAIAGWTGFGVPIVQTVILLAWSLAESVVDINNLCEGEAVCIYKSNHTWVLGIGGLKDTAKDAASKAVGDIFEKVNNLADDAIDGAEGYVNVYIQKTQQGLVDSVKGSIMSSIENLIIQVVGESNYNLTKDDIAHKVDDMLNNLNTSISGDSILQNAKKIAINSIKSEVSTRTGGKTPRDYLVDKIYSAYSQAKDGVVTAVSNEVETILNNIANAITSKIRNAVSSCGDTLKSKVRNILDEGGSSVKEKINSAIDDYTADIGGNSDGGKTALASGMTLTYKEYLKAFIMINIVANEKSMLKRCAKLIQANVSQSNSSFDISKAYTMIEVNATVSIRTTFFSVPVSTGVDSDGSTTYSLDFSNIGSDRQKIKYVGILGY